MSERVYNLLKKIHDDEKLKSQFDKKVISPQICNEYGNDVVQSALAILSNPKDLSAFLFSYYISSDLLD